jgi:hypothetical protein
MLQTPIGRCIERGRRGNGEEFHGVDIIVVANRHRHIVENDPAGI